MKPQRRDTAPGCVAAECVHVLGERGKKVAWRRGADLCVSPRGNGGVTDPVAFIIEGIMAIAHFASAGKDGGKPGGSRWQSGGIWR